MTRFEKLETKVITETEKGAVVAELQFGKDDSKSYELVLTEMYRKADGTLAYRKGGVRMDATHANIKALLEGIKSAYEVSTTKPKTVTATKTTVKEVKDMTATEKADLLAQLLAEAQADAKTAKPATAKTSKASKKSTPEDDLDLTLSIAKAIRRRK